MNGGWEDETAAVGAGKATPPQIRRLSHKHDKMDGLIMKNSFSSPDRHHQGSFAASAVVVVGFIYINAGRTRKSE